MSLARRVLQDTHTCLLVGNGALKFARKINFPILKNPLELVTVESRLQLEGNSSFNAAVVNSYNTEQSHVAHFNWGHDTVGAVAMDSSGRLASATSTGQC